MVERVETWVEHPVLGDLLVDTTYSDYKDFGGVKVPSKIVQKRAELTTFEATITAATANPPNIKELLTPPAPAAGVAGAGGRGGSARRAARSANRCVREMAEGVYRITGGYVALAVEFKDHVVVLEGGQSEARGIAVIAETKQVIPNKPISTSSTRMRTSIMPAGSRRSPPRASRSSPHGEQQELSGEGAQRAADARRRQPREGEPKAQGRVGMATSAC